MGWTALKNHQKLPFWRLSNRMDVMGRLEAVKEQGKCCKLFRIVIIMGKSEKITKIGPETAEIEQNSAEIAKIAKIWKSGSAAPHFENLEFSRFLGRNCSISAVSGSILMIFSLFSTTITTLNNLKHFPTTLGACKCKSPIPYFLDPQNANFWWFLNVFWAIFRAHRKKSQGGNWCQKMQKISKLPKIAKTCSKVAWYTVGLS